MPRFQARAAQTRLQRGLRRTLRPGGKPQTRVGAPQAPGQNKTAWMETWGRNRNGERDGANATSQAICLCVVSACRPHQAGSRARLRPQHPALADQRARRHVKVSGGIAGGKRHDCGRAGGIALDHQRRLHPHRIHADVYVLDTATGTMSLLRARRDL